MEELLDKIDEREEKLGGMFERHRSMAAAGAPKSNEVAALQAKAEQLHRENKEIKSTLEKVRRRVSQLLERIEQMSAESGQAPSLF